MAIRLRQGQIWKHGDDFIRLVQLDRLTVRYKAVRDLASRGGAHHDVSKKEFCRLIKSATLLTPEPAAENSPAPAPLT